MENGAIPRGAEAVESDRLWLAARSRPAEGGLVDPFGRRVTYLRVSVTDRCDFRCIYCMAEDMTFLPKAEVLTLEELDRICGAFVERGVRKLRITGGEPLVRRDVMRLFRRLGRFLDSGLLDELTLTTNGSQLEKHAADLFAAGVRRINVSLDTLDPEKFRAITRRGDLSRVLAGIRAARAAGHEIKINTVALRGVNDGEFDAIIRWCGDEGLDLTLIETMPMGEIDEDRTDRYLPLSKVRADLEKRWTLEETDYRTGGPSRYARLRETGRISGSSLRCPTISANRATASGSRARARCTCASDSRTRPTCARRSGSPPTTTPCCSPASTRPSAASRRAMTSSSTGAARTPPSRGT